MAESLGVVLTPSALGGTNYAIGGAATGWVTPISPPDATPTNNYLTTRGPPFSSLFAGMGIDAAVGTFRASSPDFDPAATLFVVWGGTSNLRINPSPTVASQAIVDLAEHIQALYTAGARNFLVANMLDLSLTPAGRSQSPATQTALHVLTLAFNAGLKPVMDQLALLPAINLMQFDAFGLFNNLIANPAAYGLTNVADACFLPSIEPCAQPDEYLFWDEVHPTARAHQLLGEEFVKAVAAPDPGTLLQQLATDVTGVGPGKSLADKVALAQTYYAVPDVQATCAVLTDFISQVKALAGKKKLATALSDQLIADAQVIMEAIGCN
jgi:phospholipase/lecithinase/hemolysin